MQCRAFQKQSQIRYAFFPSLEYEKLQILLSSFHQETISIEQEHNDKQSNNIRAKSSKACICARQMML